MARRTTTCHRGLRAQSPVQLALEHVPGDLAEITKRWPAARELLGFDAQLPPRLSDIGPDDLERQAERDRAERAERVTNARAGRVPLGYSPAPTRVDVLEDLALVEVLLLQIGDELTDRMRRRRLDVDDRLGPHRLARRDVDENGYPNSLGYARRRILAGKSLTHIAHPRHTDRVLASIRWITLALPTVVDVQHARRVAGRVSKCERIVRQAIGEAPLMIRLKPSCAVCGMPSLRLNLDDEYVECRNPDCDPPVEWCGFKGPRGEPRWYKGEFEWLAAELGVAFTEQMQELGLVMDDTADSA